MYSRLSKKIVHEPEIYSIYNSRPRPTRCSIGKPTK